MKKIKMKDYFTCDVFELMENESNPSFFTFYSAVDGDIFGKLTLYDDRLEFIHPNHKYPIDCEKINLSPNLLNQNGEKNFIVSYEDLSVEADIITYAMPSVIRRSNFKVFYYIQFRVYQTLDR